MGLDQYAYITKQAMDTDSDIEPASLEDFYWRKHAKLQKFMELLWKERGNDGEINCQLIELTKDDVLALLAGCSNDELPASEGGFFYGHQYQDESADQYREDDIAFCHKAVKALNEGFHVTYSCWY
jgi:hypothetical protein